MQGGGYSMRSTITVRESTKTYFGCRRTDVEPVSICDLSVFAFNILGEGRWTNVYRLHTSVESAVP